MQPYRARCFAALLLAASLPASSATYGVRFCCGFSTTDAGYAGADFAFVGVAVVVVLPTLPSELHALIAHTLARLSRPAPTAGDQSKIAGQGSPLAALEQETLHSHRTPNMLMCLCALHPRLD